MKPVQKFLRKPKSFWASIRTLSQHIGYSAGNTIIVPTYEQMAKAFEELGLNASKIILDGTPTPAALELREYFSERARLLMTEVEPNLMDAERAGKLFKKLRKELNPKCPLPMNKQKVTCTPDCPRL